MENDNKHDIETNDTHTIDIADEMRNSFLEYAMSVIVSRAIPDVKDGLKPVHRRIVYAMNVLGITNSSPYKKSARIVGEVIGKYHPHGDTSVYDAMVRMAQDFSYRYPLIDGHGNFGSIDGDPPAAMRYTEARMSKISGELIKDIDKETVPFVDNYDGCEKEPLYLPGYFPNLLVNGSNGIAVGMATNIPPHNLDEVIDATIALIDNSELEIVDLMQYIKGPDFPTGALITAGDGLYRAYTTGNGSVTIRAKLRTEETKRNRQIIVEEIPYQVNKSKLLEKIVDLVKNKIITGIVDLRDESNREGIRIVIDLKRDAQEKVILNKLYKFTPMQVSFAINLLALHNNQPKVMNLKQIIAYFIEHALDIIVKRSEYDLKKSKARLLILEGLKIALDNIDRVIEIIKKSQTVQIASQNLMDEFGLVEVQTKAILEMRLQRLTGLEKSKIEDEIISLRSIIKELEEIIASEIKQKTILKQELVATKQKFGDKRRSQIIQEELIEIDPESLIKQEDVLIILTKDGYIKKTTQDTFKVQKRGGKGILGLSNNDDSIHKIINAKTLDDLLIFSNLGKVYRIKTYEIDTYSRSAHGIPIINLISIEKNEQIVTILPVSKANRSIYKYLVFATKSGLIKKTKIDEFELIRQTGKTAITLKENDELVDVVFSEGQQEIVIANNQGKVVRFNETMIKPLGRQSFGIKGIGNGTEAHTVGICVGNSEANLVSISQGGFGKKTHINEYRLTERGTKGVKSMNLTEKTKELVAIRLITPDQDLIIANKSGNIIRLSESDIPQLGRTTSGVKMVRLDNDDIINGVEIILTDKEEMKDDDRL